jgi:hypothetical protein
MHFSYLDGRGKNRQNKHSAAMVEQKKRAFGEKEKSYDVKLEKPTCVQ